MHPTKKCIKSSRDFHFKGADWALNVVRYVLVQMLLRTFVPNRIIIRTEGAVSASFKKIDTILALNLMQFVTNST